MKQLNRWFVGLLALSMVLFTLPQMPWAQPLPAFAAAQITQTPPEIRSSPEIKIAEASDKQPASKVSHKWLWALLGLALIGGAAAAGGGGGGGGGGGTGSVSGSW
jgi:hypothetical protein